MAVGAGAPLHLRTEAVAPQDPLSGRVVLAAAAAAVCCEFLGHNVGGVMVVAAPWPGLLAGGVAVHPHWSLVEVVAWWSEPCAPSPQQ